MTSPAVASISSSLPPLQIEGLVKRFAKLTAVSGVSLQLNCGECLGLLGPNGAGKSTVIRSIVGRVIPDAGSVSIFGNPADSVTARMALGWVPQELALYSRLTCRENLETFGEYHGLRRDARRTAVDWCLEWAALTDRARDPVNKLSGGMKRRLNLAAGLIHRPKVVLMDEPTVGKMVDFTPRRSWAKSFTAGEGSGMGNNATFEPHEGCCNALTRSGGRCRQRPVPGRARCHYHGGRSTGPRTPEGKARSSRNRLVHGRRSKTAREERAVFRQLLKDMRDLLKRFSA